MVLRESPIMLVNLRPSSDRSAMPVVFIAPRVSRGWKMCEDVRDECFANFVAAACFAAPPGLANMDK